jgi:hypothetical protein
LEEHHEIVFALALGSFIEGGPFRDLDIAVFLRPDFLAGCDFRYEMQMESRIEKALNSHFTVDIRILNNAGLGFQYHALRGRLLLDREPDIRIAFTRQVAARYLDIAPILKHHTREAFALESES